LAIWYPIKSVNITSANAKKVSYDGDTYIGHSFQLYSPSRGETLLMYLNTTTGKFTHLAWLGMDINFTWSDGSSGGMGAEDESIQVKAGDGIHVLKGSIKGRLDWTIHMRKRR